MGNESGDVSVVLRGRPDPDTIRAWDHLVSHTSGSDVAQLSACSAMRSRAGFLPATCWPDGPGSWSAARWSRSVGGRDRPGRFDRFQESGNISS